VQTGSANVEMISAPWDAGKSQSYTVSGATRTQRAALNHQAAGPTKKCFGSIRISKERYTIPPMTWIRIEQRKQQPTRIKLERQL